jgi:hypothetical protein
MANATHRISGQRERLILGGAPPLPGEQYGTPDTTAFALPVTLAIVGNEATVVLNVGVKLFYGSQQFAYASMATGGHRGLEVPLDGLHDL